MRASNNLLQTLDALSNERPSVLLAKRKHFGLQSFSNTKHQVEWMRTSAEQDRCAQFKRITIGQSRRYYAMLDSFTRMLELKQTTGTV